MQFERLKKLRKEHGLSQEKVANILLIQRSQYSLYENGKRLIPVDLLCILAKLYNTSIDYIVGDTDIITRYTETKNKKSNKYFY